MTNLQKMFNGDLAAADKWAMDTANASTCGSCQIRPHCEMWNTGVYRDNMTCIAAHIRWLLEEAKEEPAFQEVSKPVQTLQVHMMCQCGGEFRRDTDIGDSSASAASALDLIWNYPYQHKCDKCGSVQKFDRIYPYIKYETNY